MDTSNLLTYKNYYNALKSWVIECREIFHNELQHQARLKMLIDLDTDKYIVDNPDILLNVEKDRFEKMSFTSIDELLMVICDTMWDMVTIRCDKDCSICGDGDLRYLKINDSRCGIILECNICGCALNVDGSRFESEIRNYLPACKDEI